MLTHHYLSLPGRLAAVLFFFTLLCWPCAAQKSEPGFYCDKSKAACQNDHLDLFSFINLSLDQFRKRVSIIYLEGFSGDDYVFWKSGNFAWKKPKSKKYIFGRVDKVLLEAAIDDIKCDFEAGTISLGGRRRSPIFISLGNTTYAHFRIANDSYHRRDFFATSVVRYYGHHGIEKFDVEILDWNDPAPFDPLSLLLENYLPLGKTLNDILPTEDFLYTIRQCREDIKHILFCKRTLEKLVTTPVSCLYACPRTLGEPFEFSAEYKLESACQKLKTNIIEADSCACPSDGRRPKNGSRDVETGVQTNEEADNNSNEKGETKK